jgi:hypothetical protein
MLRLLTLLLNGILRSAQEHADPATRHLAERRGHQLLPEEFPQESQHKDLRKGAGEETVALLQLILCADYVR